MLKRDPTFNAWLARLADLDREERSQSEQEVAEALYQDRLPSAGIDAERSKLFLTWF